jgi:hypothetical protein
MNQNNQFWTGAGWNESLSSARKLSMNNALATAKNMAKVMNKPIAVIKNYGLPTEKRITIRA